MNRTQTFVLAILLDVVAVALYLTGHSDAGALALGASIGALTPTDPTGRRG